LCLHHGNQLIRLGDVCHWHLTDVTGHADDVRSSGQADITSPLAEPLLELIRFVVDEVVVDETEQ